MHTIKTTFRAVAPPRHRRWDGKWTNPKVRVRRRGRRRFGHAGPRR